MKVNLEKNFPMPVSAETAWHFLQDIEAVAVCMPGAKITEQVDETHFKGIVNARVGPATLAFSGSIEVLRLDHSERSLRLLGKGQDRSGTSLANMDLTARIEATQDGNCALIGVSEVSMTGKAATFGGRMLVPVADQILKQFAANFEQHVRALETTALPCVAEAAPDRTEKLSAPSLNVLALAWGVVKAALRKLFGRNND